MSAVRNFSRKLFLDCAFYSRCSKLDCPLNNTPINIEDPENVVCKLPKETRVALAQTNKGILRYGGLTKVEFELEMKNHKILKEKQ